MSFGPQVVMPGAFHFEASNDNVAPSGVHPGIFRQPVSPSPSTSVYLGRSTGSLYSDPSTPAQNVKRKRQAARESTPLTDWTIADGPGSNPYNMAEGRKPDLGGRKISGGKRRYVLAGQINTPSSGGATKELGDNMEDSVYSDIDYRRALGSKRSYAELDSHLHKHTTDSISGRQQPGWSTFAIQTIGGVVGKVWEFCRTGAFRGFYAGGGKGYEMEPPSPSEQHPQQHQQQSISRPSGGQVWCNEHDIPTLPSYDSPSFPQSDYSPYYYERETPQESLTPPQPSAKRRQINDGASTRDEIRRNWVVVNEPASAADEKKQQQRRQSSFVSRVPTGSYNPQYQQQPYQRPSVFPRRSNLGSRPIINRLDPPRFNNRRASSRASVAGSASSATPRDYEPASYASPRSSASAAPVAAAAATPPTLSYHHDHHRDHDDHHHHRSPSRIPVPMSHGGGSRPQTPSSAGHRSAYSPASRIASPSPSSPYARTKGGSSSHRRAQSTASVASTASASVATVPSNTHNNRTPGGGVGPIRGKRDSTAAAAAKTLDLKENSPRLDREAKKLAAQRRQAEREADLRINDFNARLREMIRQGKEALGTSVEVDLMDGNGDGERDPWEDD
ncbi:hypothetical protein MGN70_003230 [Eutypa lata]|uniref:Uncharacterized protein n=1 Tax=Eutypa lata (strain UCR-EL1) TaxID=1287681 RepID=M7SPS8_EUTLA|nr:hypothetical protein UCREL1_6829 [Eutypa lata UCREL1]KAI1255166.1 hypothetical protein MGN70_003230 [Eutypa lata]